MGRLPQHSAGSPAWPRPAARAHAAAVQRGTRGGAQRRFTPGARRGPPARAAHPGDASESYVWSTGSIRPSAATRAAPPSASCCAASTDSLEPREWPIRYTAPPPPAPPPPLLLVVPLPLPWADSRTAAPPVPPPRSCAAAAASSPARATAATSAAAGASGTKRCCGTKSHDATGNLVAGRARGGGGGRGGVSGA